MGGVDIADQHRQYYSTQITTGRTWMPLFFWLLDTAIINSYLICKIARAGSTAGSAEATTSAAIAAGAATAGAGSAEATAIAAIAADAATAGAGAGSATAVAAS